MNKVKTRISDRGDTVLRQPPFSASFYLALGFLLALPLVSSIKYDPVPWWMTAFVWIFAIAAVYREQSRWHKI